MNSKFNKLIGSAQAKLKYKKQCLKSKNILFQNDNVQIGCKFLPFYDFYSSKNYIQMQIFIGNKTNKKLQRFNIHFRGTPNIELFIEEKNKIIPENSQYKQRVMVDCTDYDKQILLFLDFQSQILTLQSVPIPITLYSFYSIAPQSVSSLPLTASYCQLLDLLTSRFQYIQQTEISANIGIFKKGLVKDLAKYFPNLTEHTENLMACQFSLRDLTNQYVLAVLAKDQKTLKIALAGNNYSHFQSIIQNLKFIIST